MVFSVSSLLLALAFMFAGNSLQLMLVLSRAEMEGFSNYSIGLLTFFYYLGFFIGCRALPHLLQRFGHIRFYSAMASAASASVITYVIWVDVWVWSTLRFLSGFCIAGMLFTAESWLTGVAKGIDSMKIFSIYRVIDIIFTISGLIIMRVRPIDGFDLFAWSSIALSISLIPIALTNSVAPVLKPNRVGALKETFSLSEKAVLGCFFAGVSVGAIWGFTPVELTSWFQSSEVAGYFLAIYLLGGFLTQLLIIKLSSYFGYRDLLTVLSTGSAIAAIFGVFMVQDPDQLQVFQLALVFGALSIPVYSLCVAHANERAEQLDYQDFVTTSSNLLLIMGIGAATGPLLTSLLMSVKGTDHAMFDICAISFGLFALVCLIKPREVASIVPEEQADYVPINTNMVQPEIDPRSV